MSRASIGGARRPSLTLVTVFATALLTCAGAFGQSDSPPEGAPRADVAEMVAPLTDAEVRQRLIEELESSTPPPGGAESTGGLSMHLLGGAQDVSMRFESESAAIRQAVAGADREFRIMLRNLTGDVGWSAVFGTMGIFVVMIAIGGFSEWLFVRLTSAVRGRVRSLETGDASRSLVYAVNRLVFSAAGLLVFSLAAYLASLGFFQQFDPLRVLTITWLFVIVLVRAARIIADLILPLGDASGPLRLSSDESRLLRRCLLLLVGVVSLLFLHGSLFVILGISEPLNRAYSLASGTAVFILAMALTWRTRRVVADLWLRHAPGNGGSVARVWARHWQIPAMVLLGMVWLLWDMNVVLGRSQSAGAALWLLLSVVAGAVARLLINAFASRGAGDDPEARTRAARRLTVPRVATSFAFALLSFSFLVEAVGGRLYQWLSTETGGAVLKGAFSITVTLIIAWILWELIRSAIDRYLPDEEPADTAMAFDGEGGEGAPASRAETLLPLLRGFLQFVLVVLVTLTTLSTLGVEIGPLLAGAGVIGLAVGFGAQKLVQDVISGIFFLVDDAFRTGEYIESAGMRGTVEKISVRSLRLRHHLGPVQTIPYSEMSTVKNHSRDYIIMKLPFRLPFDTDIEKVRKIIKRIGRDMLDDPELGPGFLAPLKSQGVLEMDDSALVLRMKFTAKPGEQWVIRREAYRRVRDALREEGIEFAHRRVTVHLPPDASPSTKEQAIGAAAVAADDAPVARGDEDGDKR